MKANCGECNRRWVCDIDPDDCDEWPDPAPITNGDSIRSMSDQELAVFLCDHFSCSTRTCPGVDLCSGKDGRANGILKWLGQEAE